MVDNFHLNSSTNSVRAKEGDAYPLGALPIGTRVHCIQMNPGIMHFVVRAAGTFATILRKFDRYVVVEDPRKHQIAYKEECMATVGKAVHNFSITTILCYMLPMHK